MLGRWQPFHDGHYALFEEIIKKTGQVCIQIRDVQGIDDLIAEKRKGEHSAANKNLRVLGEELKAEGK